MGSSRKGKNKKKNDEEDAVISEGASAQLKKCNAAIAVLYAPVTPNEEPSTEFKSELKTAFFEYRNEMQREHTSWAKDVQVKVDLKREARAALPTEYQAASYEFGSFLAPLSRTPATVTPPIPGYYSPEDDPARQ